jgi:Tfp pilus assembly protein FimT
MPCATRQNQRLKARGGYTLIELVVILVVLIVLGAALIPTLSGFYSNTHQKVAADLILSRIVEARAKAMEQGVWYRLAVNQSGTTIRLAPDGPDFSTLTPDNPPSLNSKTVEDKLEKVTAVQELEPNDTRTPDNDWLTIITVGPEGITKEQLNSSVFVKEAKFEPIVVQIRGMIGSVAIVPPPKKGSK